MRAFVYVSIAALLAVSNRPIRADVPDADEPTFESLISTAPKKTTSPVPVVEDTLNVIGDAEVCDTKLLGMPSDATPPTVVAEQSKAVKVPRASLPAGQTNRELSQIVEAFQRGEVRSIDIVQSYKSDLGSLQRNLSNSPLMRGKIGGEGAGEALKAFDANLTVLTKIVRDYSPDTERVENPGLLDRAKSIIGWGQNKAANITASWESKETQILEILKGLGDGRAGIELDIKFAEDDIDNVSENIEALDSQIKAWNERDKAFSGLLAELEQKQAEAGGGDRILTLQIQVVKNQIRLPIVQTLMMLEQQADIEMGILMNLNSQIEQNKNAIQTGYQMEQTAGRLLPRLVQAAAMASNLAKFQNVQLKVQDTLELALNGISEQMARNAKVNEEMMKTGAVRQGNITKFREEILRIAENGETTRGAALASIDQSRQDRARRNEEQRLRIQAVLAKDTLDGALELTRQNKIELPAPTDQSPR